MNQKECCKIEKKYSSLIPLYILLGGIVGVSLILTYFFESNTFMMYLMGVWFLAFGLLKLYDLSGFARSFSQYDIIAKRWSAYGYIFPFIEIIIGLIYILNTSMLYMTEINSIALIISLLGIMSAYKIVSSGQSIACACMGTYWKLPMTKVTIIENLFMFLMVGYMLVYPASMMNMSSMNMDSMNGMPMDEDTIMSSEMMTPSSNNDDAMREHCKMMPEMAGCEKYKNDATTNDVTNTNKKSLNELVLVDDETTTDVKSTEVVNLKDGDTYDLTIQKVRKVINGKTFIMLSYNGSIPGPTFRAPKGATIKFKVRNTVKELATTIHPHGIRLNYLYDGVPRDQGGAQDPIKVGDVYEQIITFPDTGVMWYHPHTRDDFEQELGEYGTFQIYDPNEKQTVDSENVITLDDILIENGIIPSFEQDTVNYTLMGRYGNTMFVNGNTNISLTLKQGEVKRLYLVNTANARPFDFAIPGVKMKLVGGDLGYYENETFVDHLIISPAERYIVDIMSEKSGNFPVQSIGGGKTISLGTLTVMPNTTPSIYKKDFETLKTHDILGNLKNTLSSYQSKTPDKSLKITMTMEGMDGMEGMGDMGGMGGMNHNMGGMGMGSMSMENESPDGIEWEDTMAMMNSNSTNKTIKWILKDEQTGKEGMDIDWSFKKGSLVKIRLTNDKDAMHPMQHPFHMHGQRFLVLNQNGTINTNLVWKDTVLIPKDQYVDILVDMSNSGNWMAHCHIVEHLFSGMMFGYKVME